MTLHTNLLRPVLLTVDEARREFVASAYRVLHESSSPATGLRMLRGEPPSQSSSVHEMFIGLDHRLVLEAAIASGHGWVIDEQLEGIESVLASMEDGVASLDVLLYALQTGLTED